MMGNPLNAVDMEYVRQSGKRFLIAVDEHGYHVRETLCVTHHEESGEVEYDAMPLASGPTIAAAWDAASVILMRGSVADDVSNDRSRSGDIGWK
jgi:hypothetical protein